MVEKYIDTSESVGLEKKRMARRMSQFTLWASAVKGLDSTKTLSWRFWSRLLTESLPTNHRLSNMVNSNSDNIYSWVYQDELGSHGACRREGCGEESCVEYSFAKWLLLYIHIEQYAMGSNTKA